MSFSSLLLGFTLLSNNFTLFGLQPSVVGANTLDLAHPYLAQKAGSGSALQGLPRLQPTATKPAIMFAANAYNQEALNYQANSKPEGAVKFFQTQLATKGYKERTVNTTVGQWGFNLVFDPPTPLTPKTAGKTVVLVLQGAMLAPDKININARFEEI
jgi:hypothetical protein